MPGMALPGAGTVSCKGAPACGRIQNNRNPKHKNKSDEKDSRNVGGRSGHLPRSAHAGAGGADGECPGREGHQQPIRQQPCAIAPQCVCQVAPGQREGTWLGGRDAQARVGGPGGTAGRDKRLARQEGQCLAGAGRLARMGRGALLAARLPRAGLPTGQQGAAAGGALLD